MQNTDEPEKTDFFSESNGNSTNKRNVSRHKQYLESANQTVLW